MSTTASFTALEVSDLPQISHSQTVVILCCWSSGKPPSRRSPCCDSPVNSSVTVNCSPSGFCVLVWWIRSDLMNTGELKAQWMFQDCASCKCSGLCHGLVCLSRRWRTGALGCRGAPRSWTRKWTGGDRWETPLLNNAPPTSVFPGLLVSFPASLCVATKPGLLWLARHGAENRAQVYSLWCFITHITHVFKPSRPFSL